LRAALQAATNLQPVGAPPAIKPKNQFAMKLMTRINEAGAAGYILLWLLGIPLPILLVIFLLRGCS
jgi:hypothetical protein